MYLANQAATQRALVEKQLLAKQVSALRAGLAEMSADTENLVGHLRDKSAAIERLTSLHDSKAAECAELQLKCSVLEEARRNAIHRMKLSPSRSPSRTRPTSDDVAADRPPHHGLSILASPTTSPLQLGSLEPNTSILSCCTNADATEAHLPTSPHKWHAKAPR